MNPETDYQHVDRDLDTLKIQDGGEYGAFVSTTGDGAYVPREEAPAAAKALLSAAGVDARIVAFDKRPQVTTFERSLGVPVYMAEGETVGSGPQDTPAKIRERAARLLAIADYIEDEAAANEARKKAEAATQAARVLKADRLRYLANGVLFNESMPNAALGRLSDPNRAAERKHWLKVLDLADTAPATGADSLN